MKFSIEDEDIPSCSSNATLNSDPHRLPAQIICGDRLNSHDFQVSKPSLVATFDSQGHFGCRRRFLSRCASRRLRINEYCKEDQAEDKHLSSKYTTDSILKEYASNNYCKSVNHVFSSIQVYGIKLHQKKGERGIDPSRHGI